MKTQLSFNMTRLSIICLFFTLPIASWGQSQLLSLKFEDNLNGEDGEIPTFYDVNFPITFQYAIDGKAAFFPEFNQLRYDEENIAELEGSIAYWIKPDWDDALDHRIFKYGGTGGMLFGTDGGGYYTSLINVAMGTGELYANFNANSWENDEWYFVVHTWNRFAPTNEEALQVYVNGVLEAQNDPNRDKTNIHLIDDDEFQIGGNGSGNSLEAHVDNFVILDYQLTDAEVLELFNSLDPPHDLVLEFENNLLGFNGEEPSFYNTSYPVNYEPGTFGLGAHFPDNNELRYNSEENINDTIGTIAAWIKPDWEGSDNQSHSLFSYGATTGMFLGKSASNELQCVINEGTGANELQVSYDISDWNDGIWYHVACTWDKNASSNQEGLQLYVNGEMMDQNDPSVAASNIHLISDDEFQIAGHPTNSSINAVLDRLIIRDAVLTADEIMQLYNEYIPPQIFSELYLEFEEHVNGACGEAPFYNNPAYPITYESGYAGKAAYFPSGNTLQYESSSNLNGLTGTLSYFIKPSWSGNASNRSLLIFGDDNGINIGTDNNGNLETILNYNGSEELLASFDVTGWNDGQWYHVVHVWNNEATTSEEAIQVFVDGILVAENTSGFPASAIQLTDEETFQVGGKGTDHSLEAALDRCFLLGYPVTAAEALGLSNGQIPVVKGMALEGEMSFTLLNKNYNIGVAENESVIKIQGVSNVSLDGNGVQSSGAAFSGYFLDIQDASMVEVTNFDTVSSYFYAVNVNNSDHISISNNNFSNNKLDQVGWIHIWHDIDHALGGGVLLHNSRKVEILDNEMQFQNDGVAMYVCDSIHLQNNNLSWNTGYGIRMFHSDSCAVINNDCSHANRITDPSDCAAILLYFSRENYVVGNDFSYGGDGIFTNENKTMGNSIPNFLPSNNYFADNDCSWSPHNAIESVFTDGNIFENNICDYSNYGLWLGYSYNLQVINNQINNNSASGVAIDRGFDNVINGNEINNNSTGIDIWEGGATGLPGYTTQMSFDYLITDNAFEANGKAIRAHKSENSFIQDNTFAYNYTDIYIEEEAEGDTITENVFGNAVNSYINNQSANDIYAELNDLPDDIDLIDCKIIDQNDDSSLGLVNYQPFNPSAVAFETTPPPDLAEPSTSFWTVFVEDGLPTTMTWDTEDKKIGDASIHIVTEGGFDVIPHYWPAGGKMADWELTEADTLQFWLKTLNPSGYQFQQFYLRMGNNCNAWYQFTTPLSNINSSIGEWVKFDVPLAGNDTWTRTSNGDVSLSEIAYFELNADTWDWGFEMWIDGVTYNDYVGVGKNEHSITGAFHLDCSPNPVLSKLNLSLSLPENGKVNLAIYNFQGLMAKDEQLGYLNTGMHTYSIDVSTLPSGMYFLELTTGTRKVVKKIIRK